MRVAFLAIGVFVLGSVTSAEAGSGLPAVPLLSGLLGTSPTPAAPVAPRLGPAATPPVAPRVAQTPVAAPVAPAAAPVAPTIPPGAARKPVEPVAPPITVAALQSLVSPAVVALLVSGGPAPARVVPGFLTTASGFVLTSRTAVVEAAEGRAMLTMVRGGPRGRLGARELAEAVPVRFVALSPDLDLALVEAITPSSVFFPHVPIARRNCSAGATVLGVAHLEKRGLWTTATTVMGPDAQSAGAARWLRALSAEGAALPLGTPLFDAVGRVVAMVANPAGAGPRAVDADGLLRFLLEANAPALRFAGVPPFRRPAPGETRAPSVHAATKDKGAAKDAAKGAAKDAQRHDDAPSLEGLARVHRRGLSAPGVPAESAPPAAPTSVAKADVPMPAAGGVAFPGAGNALIIAANDLDKRPVPANVTIEIRDVPERGPRGAAVTIVELGDYHAPETREAEAALKALVEGPDAQARWLWKDTDRGEGDDYHVSARAAHAAREQDEFWPMHDILMKAPMPISMKDIRRIARAFELEMTAFEAAYASEGLVGALQTESDQAGRLPALATPAFIVNGHLVDGGSVAGPALRAAVEQELMIAEARLASQPAAAIDGLLAARARGIAAGKPVAGTAFDATKMARTVSTALARQSGKNH